MGAPTPGSTNEQMRPRLTALLATVLALLLAAPAAAEERGVFTADSYKSGMSLAPASKSRKDGPARTLGPVPAGVAWDGASLFTADSYKSDMSLAPASKSRKDGPARTLGPVPAGVAWDGASLWSAAGGAVDTINLMRWSKSGKSIKASHTPQLDIRAIWTQVEGPEGALYADAYDDDHVYMRKQNGSFEPTGVILQGAIKDTDSPVLYRPNSLTEDPVAGVLVAHDGAGALLEFDAADGKFVRDVPLNNYGSEPGEKDWPAYTRFAVADVGPKGRFFYLTYAEGMVHAWDAEGNRAGGAELVGANDDEMGCHSFSFANGRAWVLDTTSNTWKGYKLSFVDPPKRKKVKRVQQPKPVEAAAAAAAEGAAEGAAGLVAPQADAEGDKGSCPIAVE